MTQRLTVEEARDAKRAAIETWTNDPCGERDAEGETGTRAYFESLLDARSEYAPWMAEALDYAGARGLRVLDVGSGQGIDVAHYARAGARATGIDLTPRHVELARAHLAALGLDAEVVEGDAEALPFPDGAFDRVSSNGVLHHTPDMAAALREVARVLRPGGEARIVVYNRGSLHYWITLVGWWGIVKRELRQGGIAGVLSEHVEYSGVGARPLVRVYGRGELRRMLETAGLERVRVEARHFRLHDTPLTSPLRRVRPLREPRLLDRVGRAAGWYLVGTGFRPDET